MSSSSRPTYGLEEVLSAKEVAEFLKVNKKTIYAAVKEGQIPGCQVGRRVVILRDALLDYLSSKERVLPPSRRM